MNFSAEQSGGVLLFCGLLGTLLYSIQWRQIIGDYKYNRIQAKERRIYAADCPGCKGALCYKAWDGLCHSCTTIVDLQSPWRTLEK